MRAVRYSAAEQFGVEECSSWACSQMGMSGCASWPLAYVELTPISTWNLWCRFPRHLATSSLAEVVEATVDGDRSFPEAEGLPCHRPCSSPAPPTGSAARRP